jgi:hypothetical protein
MLYRNAAARSALRAIQSSNASVARSSMGAPIFKAQLTSSARAVRPAIKPSFALAAHKPVTTALVRYASSSAKVGVVSAGATYVKHSMANSLLRIAGRRGCRRDGRYEVRGCTCSNSVHQLSIVESVDMT